MSELGTGLNIHQKQMQVSLNLLSLEEEHQILPEVCTRDGNRGGLKVPPIHIELKKEKLSGGNNIQFLWTVGWDYNPSLRDYSGMAFLNPACPLKTPQSSS
jgi:hypothetical protein